jgi:hypothetical protein
VDYSALPPVVGALGVVVAVTGMELLLLFAVFGVAMLAIIVATSPR